MKTLTLVIDNAIEWTIAAGVAFIMIRYFWKEAKKDRELKRLKKQNNILIENLKRYNK